MSTLKFGSNSSGSALDVTASVGPSDLTALVGVGPCAGIGNGLRLAPLRGIVRDIVRLTPRPGGKLLWEVTLSASPPSTPSTILAPFSSSVRGSVEFCFGPPSFFSASALLFRSDNRCGGAPPDEARDSVPSTRGEFSASPNKSLVSPLSSQQPPCSWSFFL